MIVHYANGYHKYGKEVPDLVHIPKTASRRDAAVETKQRIGRFDGITLNLSKEGDALRNWTLSILFGKIQIIPEVPRFGL